MTKKRFSFEDDPSFNGHSPEWWADWRRNSEAHNELLVARICDGCLLEGEGGGCIELSSQEQGACLSSGKCDNKIV
jgi:hypothetical protein